MNIGNAVYAQISNGRVENLIICSNFGLANQIARTLYGNRAIAVDVTKSDVSVGDIYEDGLFYKEDLSTGARVEAYFKPSTDNEIDKLKEENDKLKKENESLKTNLSYAEMAMLDMYESMLFQNGGDE